MREFRRFRYYFFFLLPEWLFYILSKIVSVPIFSLVFSGEKKNQCNSIEICRHFHLCFVRNVISFFMRTLFVWWKCIYIASSVKDWLTTRRRIRKSIYNYSITTKIGPVQIAANNTKWHWYTCRKLKSIGLNFKALNGIHVDCFSGSTLQSVFEQK